jgi:hypothetical protein
MSAINKLGSGVGYIYATLPSTTTIVAAEKNTAIGVRNMRALGAVSAPIAAAKSSVGTIKITNAGTGSITFITINAVNQIAAAVPVVTGDADQTALDLSIAINSYTPTGYVFTAEAIGDTVYIYSTPEDGAAVNTLTITIAVSNLSTTTTTTAFEGGSSQGGIYDTTIGLMFYLDPTANAAPNTVAITAQDVSAYMIVRGLQTGIYTDTMSVNALCQLTNLVRCSAITNIKIDTFGGGAAYNLEFIDPTNFVQGDVIRFVQEDASRVVTLVDAANATTSPVTNIYLTNTDPFVCQGNKSIELRLQYDNVLGPIFVENSRSFTPAPNILTVAQMLALMSAGQVQVGQNYLLTDAAISNPGIAGVQVQGISSTTVSSAGEALFYLPDYQNVSTNFGGVYNALMPSVTAGFFYAYGNVMYVNNTGSFLSTPPPSDAVNWTFVAITNPAYQKETHSVQYNIFTNQITKREDARGNIVTGVNACLNFQWGNAQVSNNIIQGGIINNSIAVAAFQNNFCVNTNIPAIGMYNASINANTMYNVSFAFSNSKNALIQNNNFLNGLFSVTNASVNATSLSISNNTITNGWIVINGGSAPGPTQFINNNFTGTSFANQFQINNQTASAAMFIQITGNFITTQTNIVVNANTLGGTSSCVFKQNSITGIWSGPMTFTMNGYNAVGNFISQPSYDTTISASFSLQTELANETITNGYSSYFYTVDLSTALVGGTLTLPLASLNAGTLVLNNGGTISKITVTSGYYPRQPIKITAGNVPVTITPTAVASATIDDIVSDGGTVTLQNYNIGGTPYSDFYTIQALQYDTGAFGIRGEKLWIKQYNTSIQ